LPLLPYEVVVLMLPVYDMGEWRSGLLNAMFEHARTVKRAETQCIVKTVKAVKECKI
jgi:hypothetical protein